MVLTVLPIVGSGIHPAISGDKKRGETPMVVTLPIATIKRILDRVTNLPERASGLFVPGIVIPTPPTSPGPRLPENIVAALEKARDDKTLIGDAKRVGHLGHYDFATLSDWCRAMRLGSDAAAVEAAVRAAPE